METKKKNYKVVNMLKYPTRHVKRAQMRKYVAEKLKKDGISNRMFKRELATFSKVSLQNAYAFLKGIDLVSEAVNT
jgi:hypothetical protein